MRRGLPERLGVVAAALRRGDTTVRAVVAEGFFNRFGFGIVTFALPLYALHLGLSLAEIGLVIAAKALVQPVVKPLMGVVIDRVGSRRGYLAATGFRFGSAFLLLFATSTGDLLAVRLLQGAASSAQEPAAVTTLARGDQGRLGRRFSAVMGARDIGRVSAGLVGGGLLALTGSFTVLWVFVAVVAAAPVWIVWRWVPDLAAPEAAPEAGTPAPAAAEAWSVLRSPRLRLVAALGLFGGLTAHMTSGMFQVYAAEVAGLQPAQIGLIYSLSIVALLVVGPTAGWVADRFGHGLLASARAVSNGVSSIVYLVFPVLGGIMGGRLLDDAGKAAFRPTWGAIVATASRQAGPRGGRVAANLDAALSLGEAVGPLVAALLWDLWGAVAFLGVRAALGIGIELVLGRRVRSALRAQPAGGTAVHPLTPGPGRLDVRGLPIARLPEPLTFTVAPRQVAAVLVDDPEAADELVGALAGRHGPNGSVLLDGQPLHACSPASVARAVSVLDLAEPPPGTPVRSWLGRRVPGAPAEELVRAWELAGLAGTVGPLASAGRVQIDHLPPDDRQRLAVASSLVGDPALLVVDRRRRDLSPAAARTLARVLEEHLGSAVVVDRDADDLARVDAALAPRGEPLLAAVR